MKYFLDLRKLKKGDIVLESGHTKKVSSTVKKVTKSNFSHAMLYIGHTVIHSVGGGVFSKNPQRILVNSKSELKVLRYKDIHSSDLMEKICEYAGGMVGALYSKTEAINAVILNKTDNKAKSRKQFCSRLVAQSYHSVGLSLVKNENYCSPEDLNKSSKLVEVLDCVIEVKDKDIKFANSIDPNLENQKETFKWLKNARKLFSKQKVDIQNLNDVGQALLDNSRLDKTVCKYITSTKYLELYNVDREINPYRYNKDLFKQLMSTNQDIEELFQTEIALNEREFERYSKNLLRARNNYRLKKLKYFKLHIKLYRSLLLEAKKRLMITNDILLEYPNHYQNQVSTLIDKLNDSLK